MLPEADNECERCPEGARQRSHHRKWNEDWTKASARRETESQREIIRNGLYAAQVLRWGADVAVIGAGDWLNRAPSWPL
jgi:hypothetical protein